MTDPTLFEFIDVLADAGMLRHVSAQVSSRFELAEAIRQLRAGEEDVPAVLFQRVAGCNIPVLASAYASDRAVALAFAAENSDEIVERIGQWLRPGGGRGVRDVLALLPALTRSLSWGDAGGNARCQQVVRLGRDVDLAQFPATHNWPSESGPSLTGGLLVTRNAENEQTVETTVAEVIDATELHVRFADRSPGLQAWNRARAAGRQLDVALCFGGPPSLWPTVWLGEILGIDATVLGEILGRPQPVAVRGRTVSVTVPAASEVVIEGRIDPELPPCEAARVATDWGTVSASAQWAHVSVHALTHAAAAVMPAVIRHEPPHDLSALDRLAERCLDRFVTSLIPGVQSLRTPPWGKSRQVVLLGIDPVETQRAREIAASVRGLSGLAHAKVVILLDAQVPIDDQDAVLSAVVASISPQRDVRVVDALVDGDDPSTPNHGSAVIIDATSAVVPSKPRKARPSPSVAETVRSMLSSE